MKRFYIPAAFAALIALPAFACDGLEVADPFARSAHGMARSGAAFMQIANTGQQDCRLVAARSDVAERVELHTHIEDDAGIMRMVAVEEGFLIPAGGAHMLARGGDHIMFLGLREAFAQGDEILVTLVFEDGSETELLIPVDMERAATHGAEHGHSHSHSHSHGQPAD